MNSAARQDSYIQHSGTRSTPRWAETLTAAHVGLMVGLSSWYLGGGSRSAELAIWIAGSFALPLLTLHIARPAASAGKGHPALWLWPWALLNAWVIASCLNPSFSEKLYEGVRRLAQTGATRSWLPSTIHAGTTWRQLATFDVAYLSAFNLVIGVEHRRTLRRLLAFAVANTALLAVFGTFQRLVSDGIYFGAVASPNPRFFATFIYGNHWSAYVALALAVTVGLLETALVAPDSEDRRTSPVGLLLVAIGAMALTPFVSGSRAGIILVVALLGFAALRWSRAQRQGLGTRSRGAVLPVIGLILLLAASATWMARDVVAQRWRDTQEQWHGNFFAGRRELYRDCWRIYIQHPWAGWGWGNFGKAYLLAQPRPLAPNRQYESTYANAHSDWLQVLDETGAVGAILLALTVLEPLRRVWGVSRRWGALQVALGAGCTAVVLYAMIEFPFGNAAVVLLWWTCFFAAVQLVRLNSSRSARDFARAP